MEAKQVTSHYSQHSRQINIIQGHYAQLNSPEGKSHLQIPQNHENKNMLLLHTLEQQKSDDTKCWPQYKH